MTAQHFTETNPAEKQPQQSSLSVVRRAALALFVMILLVAAAGGISLWFATSVQQSVQAMRLATSQAIRLSDLQLRWLSIAGILDTFSVTRPSPETKEDVDQQLNDLNRMLSQLATDPPGLTQEKIEANRQIAENLQNTGLQLTDLVRELYDLVEQGRWGTALQKRQTTMAGFQTELTNNLNQLNANIQSDVSSQVAEIARLQSLARQFSLAAIGAGVMFSILAVWYTRRTVLTPINRLIQDVQQVSRAQSASELQPIEPLHQQDEIGELSRAMTRMVNWLRESYGRLEEQVQERTSHLQRRSVQLEVTAQVARDIAATRDLETLLYRAVNTILDRFDFYHAGIFLIDQRQEYAVLRSATGEAGREMLARNHRLKIGETGLVGYVAQRGEARIASDVDMDTVHYKNPLLPETRSEAALPLKAAGRVIGVLDVQSREASAFDEESLAILQIMADQLAIAIQNARLLQESQMNLRELEATYGRYNRQAWDRFIYGRQVMGYDFDGVNALPYFRHALMEAQTMRPEDRTGAPFQIPLRVRNEVIGSLDVWTEEDELSDAEVFLLVTISNRLSQILESARLYEEAQLRAVREQSINQLTASLSRLLETDDVLKAAAQNLGSLPGVSEATVYLNTAGSSAQMLGLVEPDGSPRQDGENGGGDGHRS